MSRNDSRSLRGLSDQCRRLARGASADDVRQCLDKMADGYASDAEKAALRESMESAPAPRAE
jgi:hypothetical protein